MLEHTGTNWCPGWESNPHEEKSPEDFKFWAPLSLLLAGQAFTTAWQCREWPSLPIFPRPSLANGHKSAIVLGPEIFFRILGSASRLEFWSRQFDSGPGSRVTVSATTCVTPSVLHVTRERNTGVTLSVRSKLDLPKGRKW